MRSRGWIVVETKCRRALVGDSLDLGKGKMRENVAGNLGPKAGWKRGRAEDIDSERCHVTSFAREKLFYSRSILFWANASFLSLSLSSSPAPWFFSWPDIALCRGENVTSLCLLKIPSTSIILGQFAARSRCCLERCLKRREGKARVIVKKHQKAPRDIATLVFTWARRRNWLGDKSDYKSSAAVARSMTKCFNLHRPQQTLSRRNTL